MNEYLVEVTPGRELVYRTPLALRAAMRSGEITPESRIYHHAGLRWISITEHPEYRKFLAERRPPDWLEPIPFEPAEPPPESEYSNGSSAGLGEVLQRTMARVRSMVARLATPPELPRRRTRAAAAPEPPPKPPPPRAVESARSSPPPPSAPPSPSSERPGTPASGRRRWTFYP